ncbi:hypothetical protein HaLaN_05688 [Haematococcus lacustris]|uniref:Uncharacterized protein n=1 Tax=Haematococcus lacustris TaxID=44745 RepID=A0A699YM32_HAELA|nr:hypothetical protein HaLaN_05688 [Haematococcus lacustris]
MDKRPGLGMECTDLAMPWGASMGLCCGHKARVAVAQEGCSATTSAMGACSPTRCLPLDTCCSTIVPSQRVPRAFAVECRGLQRHNEGFAPTHMLLLQRAKHIARGTSRKGSSMKSPACLDDPLEHTTTPSLA